MNGNMQHELIGGEVNFRGVCQSQRWGSSPLWQLRGYCVFLPDYFVLTDFMDTVGKYCRERHPIDKSV